MRVAIAGAGDVGRSIAEELLDNGHEVLLIDRDTRAITVDAVPRAEWLLADACELSALEGAHLDRFDAVVAASGDDKVNLVVSLLAKTEFATARVIARINDPKNEWLFTDAWGVDVAVSPPRLMASLVDTAGGETTVGDAATVTHLPETDLLELTLPADAPYAEGPVNGLTDRLPDGTVLVAVVREGHAQAPEPEMVLRGGDELVFLSSVHASAELGELVAPS